MPHTGQRLFNNKVLVNIRERVRDTDSVYNKCTKKELTEFITFGFQIGAM